MLLEVVMRSEKLVINWDAPPLNVDLATAYLEDLLPRHIKELDESLGLEGRRAHCRLASLFSTIEAHFNLHQGVFPQELHQVVSATGRDQVQAARENIAPEVAIASAERLRGILLKLRENTLASQN